MAMSGARRSEIEREIAQNIGIVPGFIQMVPDDSIEAKWRLFQSIALEEKAIPNRYKELIGLGVAATMKCRYCTLFHTSSAHLNAATEGEIREALEFAASTAMWSTWINGLAYPMERFEQELRQIAEHVRKQLGNGAGAARGPGASGPRATPSARR